MQFGLVATATIFLAAGGLVPSLAVAEESAARARADMDTVVARGRIDDLSGIASSASQGRVGQEDIQLRPLLREGELLEVLPGMIATQHSGDGKANQLYLRGFNLDHGTDFRTIVEGMPVNLPTHGHGQGYTDVNFLIPELVDYVEFQKGVYYANTGDFGSAGAARFQLFREVDLPFFKFEIGEDRFRRAVAAGSERLGSGVLLVGGEVKGYDGPWERAQDLKKASGLVRYTWSTEGGSRFSLLGLGYSNEWDSSDQIPRRLVANGTLGSFGQIDETLGGESSRYSLAAQWGRSRATREQRANLWVIDYGLDLYSNFTYFLEDSSAGDQIEQVDDRTVLGGDFSQEKFLRWFGRDQRLAVGLETRTDFIRDVALYRTTERRRVSTVRRDEVLQTANGVWASFASIWHPKIRSEVGIRGDLYHFDVESKTRAENSGTETDAIASPKLSLVFEPWADTEIYANAGFGFHSNDARGTTIVADPETGEPTSPVDPLVPSRGAEIGVRVSPVEGLRSTVAVWGLELDSELLFVGDAGTTEASEKSRRVGLELANFWRVSPHLSLDLDLAFTRARFLDTQDDLDRIPGALENVVAAGVAWSLPNGFFGSARVRHLGEYPLIEDDSIRAEATTLVNASVGLRFGGVRVAVSALNLLDEEASDIQYFYASRVGSEAVGGVEDVHFHPVEPLQFRTSVTYGF